MMQLCGIFSELYSEGFVLDFFFVSVEQWNETCILYTGLSSQAFTLSA